MHGTAWIGAREWLAQSAAAIEAVRKLNETFAKISLERKNSRHHLKISRRLRTLFLVKSHSSCVCLFVRLFTYFFVDMRICFLVRCLRVALLICVIVSLFACLNDDLFLRLLVYFPFVCLFVCSFLQH